MLNKKSQNWTRNGQKSTKIDQNTVMQNLNFCSKIWIPKKLILSWKLLKNFKTGIFGILNLWTILTVLYHCALPRNCWPSNKLCQKLELTQVRILFVTFLTDSEILNQRLCLESKSIFYMVVPLFEKNCLHGFVCQQVLKLYWDW